MQDSIQDPSATGLPSVNAELRNSLKEQQEILSRVSQELDDYFAIRGLGKNE